MDQRLGLQVIYTDENGLSSPATISSINDDGSVNVIVFVSEINGFRNDQINVNYSEIVAPNTWKNI